jgi:adenylate kinase
VIVLKNIKQQYLFAVDQAKRQTQRKVVKAISGGMGSGLTKNVELSDVIDEEWSEYLNLDLRIKTSKVFADATFWHCREGINKRTMTMLNQEFNLFRGLFPLKLFITGPPASSKTHYAHLLSELYGVPHIKISDLVSNGYKLQDALGEEIRKKAEEIKDQIVADYDKTKKKKDPELDRNTIKVRLPDEILYKLLKL